ncbi:MAG: 4-alpha-glucanotransferase, partial [Cytophagales bacterium]|nr:4-alpha-glucanotransferase [Cytophagales bacterium]
MLHERSCGILLPVTSLPSRYGIGDFGENAYRFADFLHRAGQRYWQILPLTPVEQGLGNSPYSSISAFAGSTLLISLEKLAQQGLLNLADVESPPEFPDHRVDYPAVRAYKEPLLTQAFHNFEKINDPAAQAAFEAFCEAETHWLDDYALFKCLRDQHHEHAWIDWEPELAQRQPEALAAARERLAGPMRREKFVQYLFFQQWSALRDYCDRLGVGIFGDLPIYVNYDSVDVWTNPHLFKLDENKRPYAVAGTPPDRFSETGQLWGNPVYDWAAVEHENFGWWMRRIGQTQRLCDLVRLDHFLGFVNYYEIPAADETAANGRWQHAPAEAFYAALRQHFPDLTIIAEDLGTISPEVLAFMARHRLPGMRVLQFAFDGDGEMNPHLPHNVPDNSVVYTSLHDTNTTRGWWRTEASDHERHRLSVYANYGLDEHTAAPAAVHLALHCRAGLAILPLQDVLNLDERSRINVPGTPRGNWEWQLAEGWEPEGLAEHLKHQTAES